MFEQYIQNTTHALMALLDKGQKNVYIKEIISEQELSEPYKKYFSAELDWWIYEENLLLEANPHFNFHNNEEQSALTLLEMLFKKRAMYHRDDLNSVISKAVKLRLNFLCRPINTLKWFVFNNNEQAPVNEIFKKLAFFSDYSVLISYISDKLIEAGYNYDSRDFLSISEFESIARNSIDINNYNVQSLQEFISPLFEFFSDEENNGSIPVEAMMIFLNDNQLLSLSEILEEKYFNNNLKYISKEYLADFWTENYSILHDQIESEITSAIDSLVSIEQMIDETPMAEDITEDTTLDVVEKELPDFSEEELSEYVPSKGLEYSIPIEILDSEKSDDDTDADEEIVSEIDDYQFDELLESPLINNENLSDDVIEENSSFEEIIMSIPDVLETLLEHETTLEEINALSENIEQISFSKNTGSDDSILENIDEIHDGIQKDLVEQTLSRLDDPDVSDDISANEEYNYTITLADDLEIYNDNVRDNKDFIVFNENISPEIIEAEMIGLPYLKKERE